MTLVAETHSEYLVRKLQYLVSKGEIRPQDVVIYYFYPPDEVPEGRNQVERINIQSDGRLDNEFGSGFFDESAKLMMSLLTGEALN
jgi:predicted ATPase